MLWFQIMKMHGLIEIYFPQFHSRECNLTCDALNNAPKGKTRLTQRWHKKIRPGNNATHQKHLCSQREVLLVLKKVIPMPSHAFVFCTHTHLCLCLTSLWASLCHFYYSRCCRVMLWESVTSWNCAACHFPLFFLG